MCTLCRHGCEVVEDLRHLIFDCGCVAAQRHRLRQILNSLDFQFTLENVFTCPEARGEVETMIGVFFTIFDDLRLDP